MYMTAPAGEFRGWGITAGISLPLAPWSLGRIAGQIEEKEAAEKQARATYAAGAAMIRAGVRELRARAAAGLKQLDAFRSQILPNADQALQAGITAYQTGGTDILSLLDSFRTYVRLRQEALMVRMRFEQTRIELERTVGLLAARTLAAERIMP
jgi:outer membrane protein TolC